MEAILKAGYVGHLYRGRGVELIAKLAERCSWAEFHVIGGMQKDIDEWRGRCAGIANIVFHGFCPPAQVQSHMARLDVMLAPYQRRVATFGGGRDTSQWMSPMKIFEYMAAGKPMIASDLPVLREIRMIPTRFWLIRRTSMRGRRHWQRCGMLSAASS